MNPYASWVHPDYRTEEMLQLRFQNTHERATDLTSLNMKKESTLISIVPVKDLTKDFLK